MPVIELDNTTKEFDDGVGVFDLDLTIDTGSIIGLIGPSGSGKTTTVRLMTGVMKPDTGTVRVFDRDPTSFSPADRHRLGYLPQDSVLYPRLSLRENLRFVASLYGVPKGRIDPMLELVELDDASRRRLEDSSGGMKRRLGLAAALLPEPELLFLDEPTAGIDPVLRSTMWDHFRNLRDEGRTLVVTTQYVGEAAYCDMVGVIVDGRLVAYETPTDLRHRALGGIPVDLAFATAPGDTILDSIRAVAGITRLERLDLLRYELLCEGDVGSVLADIAEVGASHNVEIASLAERPTNFDDVFTHLVKRDSQAMART